MGRLIGAIAMTTAQRQQHHRDKLRRLRPIPSPELLTLDADAIVSKHQRRI